MNIGSKWMEALRSLRERGHGYVEIADRIGASSRSVRRWDQHRVLVEHGGSPSAGKETAPIGAFANALIQAAEHVDT